MAESQSYCAAMVRRSDHDRFLTALFAPPAAREHLFALYAFNLEVAKIRETVSEPMLGQIRLQWWREAIDGLYSGRPRPHPVIDALKGAVEAGRIGRGHFDRIIDGREFDLAGRAPATMAELEAYCEATSSALLALAAEVLGAGSAVTQAALRPLGVGWALTGLIRAVPFHVRAQRQFIPEAVAAAAGLTPEILFALRDDPALQRAAAMMAAAAERHLAAAESQWSAADAAARPLMLYGTLARASLRRLKRRGYRIMANGAETSRVWKPVRLWWAARGL